MSLGISHFHRSVRQRLSADVPPVSAGLSPVSPACLVSALPLVVLHTRCSIFQIPLCGYGGGSHIQISLNSRDPPAGAPPKLTLDMTAPDGSRLAGLMISNSGLRTAYVRLMVFTGESAGER